MRTKKDRRSAVVSEALLASLTPAERSLARLAGSKAVGVPLGVVLHRLAGIAADPRRAVGRRAEADRHRERVRSAACEGLPSAVADMPLPMFGPGGKAARADLARRVGKLTADDRAKLLGI